MRKGSADVTRPVNRDGERIYYLPGQVNYDRLEPEMLFENEAQAEGVRLAQRQAIRSGAPGPAGLSLP